jgi:hypothetical protein
MKYEAPEATALTPAINAIQGSGPITSKVHSPTMDSPHLEAVAAYADWED